LLRRDPAQPNPIDVYFGLGQVTDPSDLLAFARQRGASAISTTIVPIGFVRPVINHWINACGSNGTPLLEISRPWDSPFWPLAKSGFFQLKARIPSVLAKLELTLQGTLL
jgi:deoxyribodipyrimidine photo-lyase